MASGLHDKELGTLHRLVTSQVRRGKDPREMDLSLAIPCGKALGNWLRRQIRRARGRAVRKARGRIIHWLKGCAN